MHEYEITKMTSPVEALINGLEDTGPVEITKEGKPVAILMSYEEYEELRLIIAGEIAPE